MLYFIAAGPGAPDLITVRGQRLLKQADVIIYAGSLVNPDLLRERKPECKIYNSAFLTLEEVFQIMIEAEHEKKMTVRLHTGDPSIFGAIREQMDLLDKEGISYECVPGVSSFLGAAAALNAEFTLPDVSQTVILTRMAGRTPVPESENLSSLAEHHATMVIFLSASMLGTLSAQLLEGGYSSDTPAAIDYKATWPDELVLRTTVGNLEQTAQKYGITKTALIFVGDFLGDEYSRSRLYDPTFHHEFREAKK